MFADTVESFDIGGGEVFVDEFVVFSPCDGVDFDGLGRGGGLFDGRVEEEKQNISRFVAMEGCFEDISHIGIDPDFFAQFALEGVSWVFVFFHFAP